MQHCTLHALGQFGALYMHNHHDKYPAWPGFKADSNFQVTRPCRYEWAIEDGQMCVQ